MSRSFCFVVLLGFLCGSASQGIAAQIESLSNPVANGSIVIDGAVGDWAGVAGFGADSSGDGTGGYDVSQLFVAHDNANYYVRIRLNGDEIDLGGTGAGLWTAFDTDKNAATGIAAFASGLGIEWNGSGVSQFNGWSPAGAHTGSILGGAVTGTRSGDHLEYEYAIPRSRVRHGQLLRGGAKRIRRGRSCRRTAWATYFEYHAPPCRRRRFRTRMKRIPRWRTGQRRAHCWAIPA